MAHIDTLQVYKDLVTSGVPEKQAEAQVHALNSAFDGVATKDDLSRLAIDTKEWINNLESRLESKIDAKAGMLMTLGGAMFIVQTLPIVELLKQTSPMTIGIIGCIICALAALYLFSKKTSRDK